MIGNRCAITAGHCVSRIKKVSFNLPLSQDGVPQESNPEDIYFIDPSFATFKVNDEGDDWGVIKISQNKITKMNPDDKYGYLNVRLNESVDLNVEIFITGYGSDTPEPNANFAQQTHYGKVRKIGGWFNSPSRLAYDIDTMAGNSGSPIILESTHEIIGVHTHGYCEVWGPYNEGTLISKNNAFQKAIQECLK